MADIDVVPKKSGTSWILWLAVAVLVAVVVWMMIGRGDRARVGRLAPGQPALTDVARGSALAGVRL